MIDSCRIIRLISMVSAGVLMGEYAFALLPTASAKLQPANGVAGDGFGFSVGIAGSRAIVGSWESNSLAGSAYLYNLNGQQLFKLKGDDTGGNDNFGISAAISGDLAIVGGRGNDLHGVDSGVVYLFVVNTGKQLRRLEHPFLSTGDEFGFRQRSTERPRWLVPGPKLSPTSRMLAQPISRMLTASFRRSQIGYS